MERSWLYFVDHVGEVEEPLLLYLLAIVQLENLGDENNLYLTIKERDATFGVQCVGAKLFFQHIFEISQ